MSSVVQEYEVFKNDKNALAFFFYHEPELDQNPVDGPFYFIIDGNNIVAGTKEYNIVLEKLTPEIIEIARQRGNLLLMEFENQQPMRATPCYLIDSF